jgi:hypothetical protein
MGMGTREFPGTAGIPAGEFALAVRQFKTLQTQTPLKPQNAAKNSLVPIPLSQLGPVLK